MPEDGKEKPSQVSDPQLQTSKPKASGPGHTIQADWEQIRERWERGERASDLAKEFGIKQGTIYARVNRQGWILRPRTKAQAVKRASELVEQEVEQELSKVMKDVRPKIREYTDMVENVSTLIIQKVKGKIECENPSLGKLETAARALERADLVGRRTLGLDRGAGQVQVGVHISVRNLGSNTTPQTTIEVAADSKQIEDCASPA
jgi:hypothetical protein